MGAVSVIGSITIDEQSEEGQPLRVQLGGVATYATLGYIAQGVTASALCNLGGECKASVLETAASLALPLRFGESDDVTRFRNYLGKGGERKQDLLVMARPIDASLWMAGGEDVDLVHLGPIHGCDIGEDLIRRVSAGRAVVALDVQGLIRGAELGPVAEVQSPVLELALATTAVLKADIAEMAAVERMLGATVDTLLERYEIDEVIITRGADGGEILARGGGRLRYRAVPVSEVVDTTGAGDVFFAGYLSARCFRGMSIEDASRAGAELAAQQVSGGLVALEDLRLRK